MSDWIWDTRDPLDPEFGCAWEERLNRSPAANFSLGLGFLSWEANRGRRSRAVMVEDGDRRGLVVLRQERDHLACGWPWRWQALIEGPEGADPRALSAEGARWLFHQVRRLAAGYRVRCYLPAPPPAGAPGFRTGGTVLYSVAHDDGELHEAMASSKRRMVRRALANGFRIEIATHRDQYRAFAEVQRETRMRHGEQLDPVPESPPAGESWREWELPWMWLLVAVREGQVESGVGDGIQRGGILEGRAAGSTLLARKSGAFALLSIEEARLARDQGYQWINLGGDTRFKRELTGPLGQRVDMFCWLGGEARWDLEPHAESAWRRARTGAAELIKRFRHGVGAAVLCAGWHVWSMTLSELVSWL
jgi:hypothetical protein